MRLVNTRNPKDRATFAQAILRGALPGGGRYLPEPIPCFRDIPTLLGMDFQSRTVELLTRFLGEEFSRDELQEVVAQVYDFPIKVVEVREGLFAAELFHGPTGSVKDFGARFLARMLTLVSSHEDFKLRTVLLATAGDTGGALAHAMRGLRGFRTLILYPKDTVSEVQEAQMLAPGGNVLAYAVNGSFDHCEALVKASLESEELAKKLNFTVAGSANIARILGMLPLWFEIVAQAREQHHRDEPVIAIPTGGCGMLASASLACKTGLGLKALVAATNANRVVPEFLETGHFKPFPAVATLSSAMDVGNPGDLERVRLLHGDNLVEMRNLIRWASLSDGDTRRSMWELHAAGMMPEPHTAVAHGVLRERLGLKETGIFLATAHPAKFRERLAREMNLEVETPEFLAEALRKPGTRRELPADMKALRAVLDI